MLQSVTECYRVIHSVTECNRVLHRTSRSLFNRRSGAVTIYASSPRTCNNHSPFIKPRSHLSDSSVPLDVRTSPVSNSRRRVMIGEFLLSDPTGANLSLVFSFFSPFSFSARKWFLFSNPRVDLYTTEYFDRKLGDKEGYFFFVTRFNHFK